MRFPGLAPAVMLAALAAAAAPPAEPPTASAPPVELHPADDPATVLVVANALAPASLRLASRYAAAREIPAANIVRIEAPAREEIDRETFETAVLDPVQDHLWRNRKVERIAYIVLVKGVPLKISGTEGAEGNRASVDSELSLLYRRIMEGPYPLNGRMPNPYFMADPDLTGSMHVVPAVSGAPLVEPARRWGFYLVTRLDAFTENDVAGMIDRSVLAPGARGRFVLDLRGSGEGDLWMERAGEALRARGAEVVIERSDAFLSGENDVLGFCSWGSNDGHYPGRGPRHGWVPGAVALGFVSSDARTFREPPGDWKPGSWRNRDSFFEGTPQSLLGDLIREGITCGIGNAYEPYLDSCARPEIFFPAYLAGYNLAEASYLSLPFLSWQTVVVGDPLCRIAAP